MLDPTALHPGRSLQETLKLNAILLDLPPSAVAEALSLAGLDSAEKACGIRAATGHRLVDYGEERGVASAFLPAGSDFSPAAQPTMPAMNSTFSTLKGSTPVAIAQPTVKAAPIPTHTA